MAKERQLNLDSFYKYVETVDRLDEETYDAAAFFFNQMVMRRNKQGDSIAHAKTIVHKIAAKVAPEMCDEAAADFVKPFFQIGRVPDAVHSACLLYGAMPATGQYVFAESLSRIMLDHAPDLDEYASTHGQASRNTLLGKVLGAMGDCEKICDALTEYVEKVKPQDMLRISDEM